jgi:hypothetical protein
VYSGAGGQPPQGGAPYPGNGIWTAQSPRLSQPGTYWWTASYSGNASNWPASSACGDPGSSVVIPAVAPGKIYYTDSPLPDVFKANLDGSNPQTIPGPGAGAVAVDSSRMYYATLQGSQIWAATAQRRVVAFLASWQLVVVAARPGRGAERAGRPATGRPPVLDPRPHGGRGTPADR